MTNKKQQIKNSIIYLIPFVTSSLAPIITIPIFTRIFTPVDFGILALSMIYAIFMCGLSNFGMSLVIDRNYFKYKNDKKIGTIYLSKQDEIGIFIKKEFQNEGIRVSIFVDPTLEQIEWVKKDAG